MKHRHIHKFLTETNEKNRKHVLKSLTTRTNRSNDREKVRSPDPGGNYVDIKQLFLDPDPDYHDHRDNQPASADCCYVDDRNKNYIIINSNHEISHVSTTEEMKQRVASSSSSPPARNAQSGGSKNFSAAKNARNSSQHEIAQQRGKDYEHVYFTNCARNGGDRQTSDSQQGEFCLFLVAKLLYKY